MINLGIMQSAVECLAQLYTNRSRATALDAPIETNVKFQVNSLPHGKQDSHTNACHTRATVAAPLDFLCKWIPLHLAYTIAVLISEEARELGRAKSGTAREFGGVQCRANKSGD